MEAGRTPKATPANPCNTIDNDIPFIGQSFGFVTAFNAAARTINAAMIEARAGVGGVGPVGLMGRHSGFIACYAALANHVADFMLIPVGKPGGRSMGHG
jgi:6-phosphofructokinase 1